MLIKPLQAGRYDDETILVKNPENGKQELFKEQEFEIVRFLKQNEQETLLALLLPNIGIAKRDHIVHCMHVLKKLKRMQIVDNFAITGRSPVSNTGTLEMQLEKKKLEIPGLAPFATFLFALSRRVLAWAGPYGVIGVSFALAAVGFLFFPFQRLDAVFQEQGFPYLSFFVLFYVFGCLAASFRSFMQGAFLQSLGQNVLDPNFSFFFGFFSLGGVFREVNITGYQSRIQMALLGLISPLAFSALVAIFYTLGVLPLSVAYFAFSASVLVTLLLACPFFPSDMADFIHVLLLRSELKERISTDLRGVFRSKGSLNREMLLGLLISLFWLLVWFDSLTGFWESVANTVGQDFFSAEDISKKLAPGMVVASIFGLIFLPLGIFGWAFVRDAILGRRKRIVVQKDKVKESLSFEERMSALEKIPLFASLNDQERLSLLNEMQPAFYRHGDFLMHQGEVGKEFFVLVRGHANAIFTDLQGRDTILADLREGDAFGEIALIDDVPRTASIRSDGGCIVMVLQKDGFDRFTSTLGAADRVKTMIRLTSFFRRHPLFSKLGVKDQAKLIDSFRFETITAGDEVNNNDDSFYVIYSGKIRVDTGDDSSETILHPDDCFGYANGLKVKFFAAEGTGLLIVDRLDFQKLIWEKLVERPELFL